MRILVIRLSAMGDVALTLPVIKAFRMKYPDYELIILTRSAFSAFFSEDKGIRLFTPDLKFRHKGLQGIWKLFMDLNKYGRIDIVADLHDVLRSKILRLLFRSTGIPVYVIDKGRKEKRSLISGKKKLCLKHTTDRYCDVFRKAGFEITPFKGKSISAGKEARRKAEQLLPDISLKHIGIAPFARHRLKQWPVENSIQLMKMISRNEDIKFWLFGGGEECRQLADIEKIISNSTSLCGKLTLEEEIAVMEKLEFMVAMDSANMHMAALAGIKVVSIWGGTDPMTGFGTWGQPAEYSIGISHEELGCRPCTIYGKGTCKRGDLACIKWLTPEKVFEKLKNLKLL
ncbi:MAG: glycosyltransferase family 9 protein [Bacteroidales bacterium]